MMKRIRYFLTVARLRHFGRAAKELHISQPPLSQQIRLLEKELGVDLLVRTTRSVDLTEAGRVLYDGGAKAVAELERAIAAAQRIHRGEGGLLRIGFVSTAASKVLPDALSRLRKRYPDATVELFHLTSSQQAEAFEKGEIDAGFLRTVPPQDVDASVIQREPLYAALPVGHRLARQRSLSVAALAAEPFVMWERRQTSGIALETLELCRKHGFEPRIALEVTNPSAMLSLVAGGEGVAIVPASALNLRQEALVFRRLQGRDAISCLYLAWRRNTESALMKRFVALVSEKSG